MVEPQAETRVVLHRDSQELATSVGALFLDELAATLASRAVAHIALTGGTAGIALLRAAGADPRRDEIDWSRVHFWWGDERFVGRDSADRNDRQAREALLARIDVPESNVHSMGAADDGASLDEAADRYAAELSRFGSSDADWPSFDICFLGVGPDAHIASLFPGRAEVEIADRAVVPVRDSPKQPPERISLTVPVINSSRRIWLVVAGADKATALRQALTEDSPTLAPVTAIRGRRDTAFFVDEAAAAEL